MIKALPFHVYGPAGLLLSGLLQPGGDTTYKALDLEPDMGLSATTPVLLVVFNLNEALTGGRGLSADSRALFAAPSPVQEFRFCRQFASELPDRRLRNKGQQFLSGRPAALRDVAEALGRVAADHGGHTPTDTVMLAAGYALYDHQGVFMCTPCASTTAARFVPQEPAAFRAVLRSLKAED
jgi:hypothetical protein